VLEVAENNIHALTFYRARNFHKLDAAIFLAKKVAAEEELLPPRKLKRGRNGNLGAEAKPRSRRKSNGAKKTTKPPPPPPPPHEGDEGEGGESASE
jgi:hypothetical protein